VYTWQEMREAIAKEPVAEHIRRIVGEGAFGPHINSTRRLEVVLGLCIGQPPEVFWPVLAEAWSSRDDTWMWQGIQLDMMRSQATRPPLPQDEYRIWRGCSRSRMRGISWTTDRAVAEGFARGHRGICVPDSVVVEAQIDRSAVFIAVDTRNEQELLVDPRRLRRMVLHKPAYPSDGGIDT
jgi:hypothetical protein